jgi:hypothetical protein
MRYAFLLLAGCWFFAGGGTPAAAQAPVLQEKQAELTGPVKLESKLLPNPIRVHEKVISGGLPESDAAFAELAALGVKTIISVDGAKPDVALAKKHGLRYVHLPHGYDGVPDDKALLLAKAVHDLPGQIYIHCHHGHHRSPAAAAVACIDAGLIPVSDGPKILEVAETSPNYRGLFESTKNSRPRTKEELAKVPADFPEIAKLPPMAQAMVQVEHAHDHLKALQANKWQKLESQPALVPAHEALLLREHFTELLRTAEVKKQPEGFQKLMAESETAGHELEAALLAWEKQGRTGEPPAKVTAALARVTKSCKDCHVKYRDVPLGEKAKQR